MLNEGQVLILTGAPGAGKTTTATALADMSGSKKVHLHADDFWHFIKNGAIAPYLPESDEQNAVVIRALAKVADEYAKGNYFVIVDGIIGPWFLPLFKSILSPLHYIVLRPSLQVSIQRCQDRGGDTLTAPEPITSLYNQFSDIKNIDNYVVNIDGCATDEVLKKVILAIESGCFKIN